jgi:hypothetical protein
MTRVRASVVMSRAIDLAADNVLRVTFPAGGAHAS